MRKILLVLIIFYSVININAGKPKIFQGTIVYKNITEKYDVNTVPSKLIYTIGDKKTINIINVGGQSLKRIFNLEEGNIYSLFDIVNVKICLKSKIAEYLKESDKTINIEYTNEEKEILGYKCKKAIVTYQTKNGEVKANAYFTEDFGERNTNIEELNVKGITLEYEIVYQGVVYTFSAINIEIKKYKSKDFNIPSDYEIKTKEELQQMYGG